MKGKKLSYKERIQAIHESEGETRKAYNKFLNHLKNGFSVDSCSPIKKTMIDELIKKWPTIWCGEEIEDAMTEGKLLWETIGMRQADGNCMGNSRTWYYNMSNRFGWSERQQIDSKVEGQVHVNIVNYSSKTPPQ